MTGNGRVLSYEGITGFTGFRVQAFPAEKGKACFGFIDKEFRIAYDKNSFSRPVTASP